MRLAGLALAVTLASAGAGAGGDAERSVKVGEAFDLRPGESARVEGEALKIGFEKVVTDSRCAKGAECVWAGDATVRISLWRGDEPKETRDVKLSAKEGEGAGAPGLSVRLLSLFPYPVSGRTIEPRDYRARLELARGDSLPPGAQ